MAWIRGGVRAWLGHPMGEHEEGRRATQGSGRSPLVPVGSDQWRLHGAVAGFGLAGVFGKLIALPPEAIVAGRAGFAAAALALLLLLRPRLRGGGVSGAAVFLGALLAAHWWMFFCSVQVATVAVALVSFSAFPILVLGYEALRNRQWPSSWDLGAAGLALAGVGVLVPRFSLSESTLRGALWGLGSGAAFAVMVVWNRRQVSSGSPWMLALVQNGVACLVLLPFLAARSPLPRAEQWGLLACLGVCLTAGTHGLFIRSLRSVPSRQASLVCTLEPVYGMGAAWLFLGEWPTARALLGAVLVVSAVGISTLKGRREGAP